MSKTSAAASADLKNECNFKVIVAIKNNSDNIFTEKVECIISLNAEEKIAIHPFSQAIFFDLDDLDSASKLNLTFRTSDTQIPFGSLPVLIPSDVASREEIEIIKPFQFGLPTSNQMLKGSYFIVILNTLVFIAKNSPLQINVVENQQQIQKNQQNPRSIDHTSDTKFSSTKKTQNSDSKNRNGMKEQKARVNSFNKSNNSATSNQRQLERGQIGNFQDEFSKPKIKGISNITTPVKSSQPSTVASSQKNSRSSSNKGLSTSQQFSANKFSDLEPVKEILNTESQDLNRKEKYDRIFRYTPSSNSISITKQPKQIPQQSSASKRSEPSFVTQLAMGSTNSSAIIAPSVTRKNSDDRQNKFDYDEFDLSEKQNRFASSKSNDRPNILRTSSFLEQSDPNLINAQRKSYMTTTLPADIDSYRERQKRSLSQSQALSTNGSPSKKGHQGTSPNLRNSMNFEKHSPIRKSPIRRRNLGSASPLSKSGYLSSPSKGNGLNFLMNLDGSKREAKNEIESLKMTIYELDSRLKNLTQTEEMNVFLQSELNKSEDARKNLQATLSEQLNFEVKSRKEIETRLAELQKDREMSNRRLDAQANELNSIARQYDQLNSLFNLSEKENLRLQSQIVCVEDYRQQNRQYRDDLVSYSGKLQQISSEFDSRFQQAYKQMLLLETENQRLNDRNRDLIHALSQFGGGSGTSSIWSQQLSNEPDPVIRKLSLSTAYENGIQIIQAHVESLNVQLSEQIKKKNEFIMEKERSERRVHELENELIDSKNKYKEDVDLLRSAMRKLQQTIDQQGEAVTEMTRAKLQFKQDQKHDIVFQELIVDKDAQVQAERSRSDRYLEELNAAKSRIYEQCELLSTQNDEISQLKQSIRELTNLVDEGEEYAQSLKQMMLTSQKDNLEYEPIKGDPIDSCLANYLNTCTGDKRRSRTLFLREGAGVYQFGSKRLYVKIEQDKVLIRTGGGFISLEEFLDLNTQSELEKYEKNDPLRLISQNYSVTKKLSQSRCVNEIKEMTTVPLLNHSLGPAFAKIKPEANR